MEPKWPPDPPLRDKMTPQALNVETLGPPLTAKWSPSGPKTPIQSPDDPVGLRFGRLLGRCAAQTMQRLAWLGLLGLFGLLSRRALYMSNPDP